PGWDMSTSQLFHEEAAHRQFFAEGQEESDEHHQRTFPTQHQKTLDGMRLACVREHHPECAIDESDTDAVTVVGRLHPRSISVSPCLRCHSTMRPTIMAMMMPKLTSR